MSLRIDELLKEDVNLEIKKAKNSLPKSFWETYSAFANTSGGIVILGLEEIQNEFTVTGLNNPQKIYQELMDLANNKSKVSTNLLTDKDVSIETINGKEIMIIQIREAAYTQKPVHLNDRMENTFIRHGEGDHRASREDLKYLITMSQDDIDNEILHDFDLDDLNLDSVERYRQLLIDKGSDSTFSNLDPKDLLIKIGAYKRDRTTTSDYKLTTGGLLFFGKYNSIRDRFPGFQLDYFEKDSSLETRWVDRVSTGDMSYPEMNIFDFYIEVINKLKYTIKDQFKLGENSQRLPFKNDLEESVREALVNSLMHAYYDADFPIKITAVEDYYEFSNPGKMRISVEEFIHGGNSRIRNTTISTLLRRVGISEKAGSGGPKIFDVASKYKLKSPEVKTRNNKTVVRIWKVDLNHMLKDLTDIEQKIMNYVIENGYITRKVMMKDLGIKEYSYRTAIQNLIDNEMLTVIGKGAGTRYTLVVSSQEHYYSMKKLLRKIEDSL